MVSTGDSRRPDQELRVGPETAAEELTELRQSLSDLSQLGTGRAGLTETLTRVAEFAVHAIPGAEGAGLTLLEQDRPDTTVATATFVSAVESIQYELRQGPCISAAEEGVTMQSPALSADSRWPLFGAQVAHLGVHSALSLPLITPEGVIGAMNIYARKEQAFNERSVELGQLFAVPAAIAVKNAQNLAQTQRLAKQLRQSLSVRAPVDQAIGILMRRNGVSADVALTILRTMSVDQHQKLHLIAQSIVDNTIRKGQAPLNP